MRAHSSSVPAVSTQSSLLIASQTSEASRGSAIGLASQPSRASFARRARKLRGGALPVAGVQAQHEVGVAEHVLFHAHVERVPRGKVETGVDIVYRQAARLGKVDERMEALGVAADELRDDHGILCR